MNTYKIKNITGSLEKRNPHFDSDVIINYVDSMLNKQIRLKPDKSVYLTINKLPISVHKLQLDGLIQITNHPKLTEKPKTEKEEIKKVISKTTKKTSNPIKKGEIKKKIVETPLSNTTKKESKPTYKGVSEKTVDVDKKDENFLGLDKKD